MDNHNIKGSAVIIAYIMCVVYGVVIGFFIGYLVFKVF